MHPLAETLLDEPVIAAVKTDEALTADIGVLQRGVRSDGRGNGAIFVFDGVCRFAACQFYDLRVDS